MFSGVQTTLMIEKFSLGNPRSLVRYTSDTLLLIDAAPLQATLKMNHS